MPARPTNSCPGGPLGGRVLRDGLDGADRRGAGAGLRQSWAGACQPDGLDHLQHLRAGGERSRPGYGFRPGVPAALLVSLAAVVVRFSGSSGEERLQLKWFAAAALLVVATFSASIVGNAAAASVPRSVAFVRACSPGADTRIGVDQPALAGSRISKYDRIAGATRENGQSEVVAETQRFICATERFGGIALVLRLLT